MKCKLLRRHCSALPSTTGKTSLIIHLWTKQTCAHWKYLKQSGHCHHEPTFISRNIMTTYPFGWSNKYFETKKSLDGPCFCVGYFVCCIYLDFCEAFIFGTSQAPYYSRQNSFKYHIFCLTFSPLKSSTGGQKSVMFVCTPLIVGSLFTFYTIFFVTSLINVSDLMKMKLSTYIFVATLTKMD